MADGCDSGTWDSRRRRGGRNKKKKKNEKRVIDIVLRTSIRPGDDDVMATAAKLVSGSIDHKIPDETISPLIEATSIRGPYFDKIASKNVTALVGHTAYLNCRVRNLGNRTMNRVVPVPKQLFSVMTILNAEHIQIKVFIVFCIEEHVHPEFPKTKPWPSCLPENLIEGLYAHHP
ncbi:zwei Ig domain protein zig-8-like [Aphis craccivora]|uniref:Zwei Ig domain protein zig-8-like n=1 Tax=Aphis craccivora TaxID=307492 RepID=A0A6G0ZK41_APHCR|nr:zwei Ig domain protein zig-8-like [Aphis craccivora]